MAKSALTPELEVQRQRLRLLRVKHGLGQVELANALGQSRAIVSLYESGRPLPAAVAVKLHELYPEDWPASPGC